jgi:acyl-coenzyme A synthetase/AMP-(fatty) acid ligase
LIVRFGFNVYPAEVEAVLNTHPAVAQSAVIGRSLEADEEIIAFVQLLPDTSLTANELAEHASRSLAPYKRPTRIIFLQALPVTPTGKVAKGELAKLATQAAAGAGAGGDSRSDSE